MNLPVKRAVVVEGGAMRGIFAAGVLDAFLENNFMPFDIAIGVSAGSTNLIGYLTKQRGRSRKILMNHGLNSKFINSTRLLTGGSVCDVEWMWRQSCLDYPLDMTTFKEVGIPLLTVVTSVENGCADYFQVDMQNLHSVFSASCAIPLLQRPVLTVNGEPYVDGGVADSIPVEKAYAMGARDITVVLSRSIGYQKKSSRLMAIASPLFRQTPALWQALKGRAKNYNQALGFIRSPPKDCIIRVIAPSSKFPVGRFSRNKKLLQLGYKEGLYSGKAFMVRNKYAMAST